MMRPVTIFPRIFGAHLDILFIIKVKTFFLIERSDTSLQLNLLTIDPRIINNFMKHLVQSLLNTCLFGVHSPIHTQPYTTHI